ncbi:hypothetical protein SRHO_G00312360 [Serrasalmus rhombeus]
MPDSAFQLAGRQLFRADRNRLSRKARGGGLCVYINKGWCTNCVLVNSHCSEATEQLTVKCRPHYLPQQGTRSRKAKRPLTKPHQGSATMSHVGNAGTLTDNQQETLALLQTPVLNIRKENVPDTMLTAGKTLHNRKENLPYLRSRLVRHRFKPSTSSQHESHDNGETRKEPNNGSKSPSQRTQ